MAVNQFPAPAAGGGGVTAFAATLDAVNTVYEHVNVFDVGVYTISCNPTTTDCQVVFASDTASIATVTTTSGSVQYNLATAATKVYLNLKNGGTAGTVVTINKTANALTPDDIGNGTLDTITSTSTYNQTGALSVLCIGGGAAGSRGSVLNGGGGGGGRSGYINSGFVYTNAATTVTIGAGGVAATANTSEVQPTGSNFGNLITTDTENTFYVKANASGSGQNAPGNATQTFPSFNGNYTTGSGSGGGNRYENGNASGGGSGIGTGGVGATGGTTTDYTNRIYNSAATDATGYGAGGGGGGAVGNGQSTHPTRDGGDGSQGVVYVLRGW